MRTGPLTVEYVCDVCEEKKSENTTHKKKRCDSCEAKVRMIVNRNRRKRVPYAEAIQMIKNGVA